MGKKYIYLEGKSLATDGAPSLVIKQWIMYVTLQYNYSLKLIE